MKFILMFIYMLKINILQIIVHGSRNPSISLQYIDSAIFEASKCTSNEYADQVYVNNNINITDIPIL
ncbi:uncharacterized protein RJT21DRAFT_119494 [Scheffersomyces amazonensis]|uniref:uncharacterized protein n=1 Tax=Scheffersomyces amazonensis TaxID=1078765 RepID=UPI00315DA777